MSVEYFEVCTDINSDAYSRLGLYHTKTGIVWKVDPVRQTILVGERLIPFEAISTLKIPAAGSQPDRSTCA